MGKVFLFSTTIWKTTASGRRDFCSMQTTAVVKIRIGKAIIILMNLFNRFVMQYLAWRMLCGLNRKIEISFLLVGHTKFAPDWCFGLLKQKFRKTLVGCLDDLARVVDQSAHTNHVETEDGTSLVSQYDWAGFFQSGGGPLMG